MQGEDKQQAWLQTIRPEANRASLVLATHVFLTGAALQSALGRVYAFLVMAGLILLRIVWIGTQEGYKWWVARKA